MKEIQENRGCESLCLSNKSNNYSQSELCPEINVNLESKLGEVDQVWHQDSLPDQNSLNAEIALIKSRGPDINLILQTSQDFIGNEFT
jgi:hypothetical protein